MIRRPTWILLLVLIALAGFMFYFNNRKALDAVEAAPTPISNYLFGPEEGLPSSIKVESSTGGTVELTHDAENAWVLKLPVVTAADQGLAEAAASQVGTLRALDEIDLESGVIGLDRPAYIITLGFTGGKTHRLEVGSETPTGIGYYARVDGGRPVIVGKTGLDALLNLAIAPPYAETPTPVPPTGSPAPVTEASPTPTP